MKYLFILNPKSGPVRRTEKMVGLIDRMFASSGHYYEFAYTTGPGDATGLARKGVDQNMDVVTAVGGDGTVNEVAAGLLHTDSAMGIVPLGSGNGVARSLNIPIKTRQSIELLLQPGITVIDTGQICDLPFVGVAGLGFDAVVGAKFQEFGIRGPVPYFIIGVNEYLNYTPKEFELVYNKQTESRTALLIAFANTRQYGNGALIAPDADPADGYLDVCIVRPVSALKAIRLSQKLFSGAIHSAPEYQRIRTKHITVMHQSDYIPIHTDGEPKTVQGILDVKIIEKSLRVCTGIKS